LATKESTVTKLVAIYGIPADVDAFDDHYHRVHVPLTRRIPGLRSFHLSSGPVAANGGAPCHLVAVLDFDSQEARQAALASPEGVAASGDLANFADGNVTVLTFDEHRL
jgi:uncharacterized protein (TIGR02118 family)